mgnify:FL=1
MDGNIVLIGMPGAGKSTLGVLLAKSLGMSFVDTDLLIQQRCGALLGEIIAARGNGEFLKIEEEVLCDASHLRSHVIATGGSAVLSARAMDALRTDGTTVYIDVPYRVLRRRLRDMRARGVVFGEGETLRTVYDRRVPLYRMYADITYTHGREPIEVSLAGLIALLGCEKSGTAEVKDE